MSLHIDGTCSVAALLKTTIITLSPPPIPYLYQKDWLRTELRIGGVTFAVVEKQLFGVLLGGHGSYEPSLHPISPPILVTALDLSTFLAEGPSLQIVCGLEISPSWPDWSHYNIIVF